MIPKSQHQLTFGGLDLTGKTDYSGVRFYALADGATLGNPTPVDRTIETQLLDGSFTVTDSHGNREPAFQVRIEASSSAALAAGEALLFGKCSVQTTLEWVPPDGWGARTVFQAFTSHLELAFNDMDELNLVRAYNLRLLCSPFGFSAAETITVATEPAPATPLTVVLSDGTSAAGWSSPASAAAQPVVDAGRIAVSRRTPTPTNGLTDFADEATFTFAAADLSNTGTQYVSVDVKPKPGMVLSAIDPDTGYTSPVYGRRDPAGQAHAYVNGTKLALVTYTVAADQTTTFTWRASVTAATTVRVVVGTDAPNPGDDRGFTDVQRGAYFDNLIRSNVAPAQSSSGRQSLRVLTVVGSARSAASVSIEHATQGLGEAVFYTSSALGVNGYVPNLRPFLVLGGTTTTDASMVSGAYTRDFTHTYSAPLSGFPSGSYLFVARTRFIDGSGVQQRVIAEVSQVEGSTVFGSVTLSGGATLAPSVAPSTSMSALTVLGVTTLPPQNVPANSNASVRIKLTTGATTRLEVDEVWAFYLGEGSDISWVDCGTGTPALGTVHNRLFVDTSTPTRPQPTLFVGTTADRSNAFNPGRPSVLSRGLHPVTPPSAKAFVITVGAPFPTVTYRVLPAWFTHAGS